MPQDVEPQARHPLLQVYFERKWRRDASNSVARPYSLRVTLHSIPWDDGVEESSCPAVEQRNEWLQGAHVEGVGELGLDTQPLLPVEAQERCPQELDQALARKDVLRGNLGEGFLVRQHFLQQCGVGHHGHRAQAQEDVVDSTVLGRQLHRRVMVVPQMATEPPVPGAGHATCAPAPHQHPDLRGQRHHQGCRSQAHHHFRRKHHHWVHHQWNRPRGSALQVRHQSIRHGASQVDPHKLVLLCLSAGGVLLRNNLGGAIVLLPCGGCWREIRVCVWWHAPPQLGKCLIAVEIPGPLPFPAQKPHRHKNNLRPNFSALPAPSLPKAHTDRTRFHIRGIGTCTTRNERTRGLSATLYHQNRYPARV